MSSIVFITMLFSSCSYFKNKGKELNEKPLAKVNDLYLYPSDLKGIAANVDKKDSVKLVQMYVTDWIKRNLLLEKAKQSSPNELKEIEEKVASYKESLILYNYENQLLSDMLDSSIDKVAKEKYYKEFQNNFILEDDVYQIQFIALPINTAQLEDWIEVFESTKDEDKALLNSKVKIGAMKYELSNNKWYTRDEFFKLLELPTDFFTKIKPANTVQKTQNNSQIILFKFNSVKPSGETAPYDRVEKSINQILLNKKKTESLNKLYKEIYDAGIQSKDAEDYMNSKK
jgi:hypothetical protein